MANKKTWLGMLVMVLVFGMTVVGCDNDPTDDKKDTALNGTWVSDETQMTLKLENGNWETLNGYPPVPWMKGTFFIRDEKIHLKSTHVFGTDIGLEEKWYTQDEVKNNFDKTINASYEESFEKSWLYPLFVVGSEYSYSLNGSELIVFWVKNEATIYLKN